MIGTNKNIIEQELIVKNNSSNIKNISIFSKTAIWHLDSELEVRTSGLSYLEFCQGVIADGYSMYCIDIVSESLQQCEQSFILKYKEPNGKAHEIAIAPVVNKYQVTAQVTDLTIPNIEFNGLNTLDYSILPNTQVRLYFQLDKNNTITESFKILNKINDFSSDIVKELIIGDKIKDCTTCDDKPKIIELPVPDMAKEASKAFELPEKIANKPCIPNPNIIEYPVWFRNKGNTSNTISIFNRSALSYNLHKFTLPYAATYSSGFYIILYTSKGEIRYDVLTTITRTQLLGELNNLGVGTWELEESNLSNNVYKCYALALTITNLFYDQSIQLPVITVQPLPNQLAHERGYITLSITATSPTPLSYQWRKSGVPIGYTTSSFTITDVLLSTAGNYDCVVTNSEGSVTSNNALILVLEWNARVSGSTDAINRVFKI